MRWPIVPRQSVLALASALAAAVWLASNPGSAADDAFARCRTMYEALRSYADTGTLVTETGMAGASSLKERFTFTTYYRAPRHFYFEFDRDASVGGDRFALWGDDAAFHTWWKTTGIEDTYPPGRGAAAFALAGSVTKNAALQISPLLFAKVGLAGTLANLKDASVDGVEDVDGRRCQRVVGVSSDIYTATGKEARVRRTTVWIDAESLLLRKVFEDTPSGLQAGAIVRVTTTFNPQANPTLDDGRFRFAVPTGRR